MFSKTTATMQSSLIAQEWRTLRANANKNQKYGIMGVIRSIWSGDMLEVFMRKYEIQIYRFSSPPIAEIIDNKELEHN